MSIIQSVLLVAGLVAIWYQLYCILLLCSLIISDKVEKVTTGSMFAAYMIGLPAIQAAFVLSLVNGW